MSAADEDFGLFGDMDIDDIPDDPWFVGAGTYYATCTKFEKIVKKDSSGYALVINYTIDEPDSDYHGFTKGDWFNLYPGRSYKDLTADEKQEVTRMKSRLKEAFDKTDSEVNSIKADDAVGEPVYLKVIERAGKGEHTGKVFSNIASVLSKRLFEEQNEGKPDNSMKAAGLSGA